MGRVAAFAAAVCLLWIGVAAAQLKFPLLSGRVVDAANVIPPGTELALTSKLAALETSTGRQLVVATVPSLGGYEIEEYGYRLGRAWGVGRAKPDDGAILLVAPTERRVRIEVGYGLEGVLTDALSNSILQQSVLPRFRADDYPGGIVAGTDALVQHLSLPEGEARARVAAAGQRRAAPPGEERLSIIPIVFIVLIVLIVLMRGGGGRRRRRGGGLLPVILWAASSGAGRGGGFGGGGGFSGGGFSGGGGSFGGGGASGRW